MTSTRALSIPSNYTDAQLRTIKHSVAADANELEFDLFMNAARSYGLDPFRRQISIIIFSKNDPKKRKHAIIVGRDGLRAIAQRCGDYRPATDPAEFVYDESLKGPTNPLGLVSCRVRLWKQDNRGDWHPVSGEAYWDEFVPIEQDWDWTKENGQNRRQPKRDADGNIIEKAGGNWSKMPRIMLQKCAEAQALRAGWPGEFAGLYVEEEMDQARAREMRDITPQDDSLTPSQRIEREETHQRLNRLGDKAILMVMDDTAVLQRIPLGQVMDRATELIEQGTQMEVWLWRERNKVGLQEFWAHSKGDALELNKLIEKKIGDFVPGKSKEGAK